MGTSKKEQLILSQQFFEKGCDHWYAHEYDEALAEFTKALVLKESLLGKYHIHTCRLYHSMGCALHGKGSYNDALIALRRSLRIATVKKDKSKRQGGEDYICWIMKKEGNDDAEVSTYQQKLSKAIEDEMKGDKFRETCDYAKALEAYQSAIKIESEAVGDGHVDIADLYVKLADVLLVKGDEQEANNNYKKALKIYQEAFGDDHPYAVSTMEKLDPGKVQDAKKSFRKSVEREISARDLLLSDKNSSKVDRCVRYFHRDRSDFRKNGGKKYDSATRYFWIGAGLFLTKKPDEALVAFRRTFRLRDAALGRDHGMTKHVVSWISDVWREQKRDFTPYYEALCNAVDFEVKGEKLLQGEKRKNSIIAALREFQRALELEEKFVGKYHLEYADLKYKIADLQADRAEYSLAMKEYRTATLIYQAAYGRGHPLTKRVFSKLEGLSKSSNLLLSISSHHSGGKSKLSSMRSGLGISTHQLENGTRSAL